MSNDAMMGYMIYAMQAAGFSDKDILKAIKAAPGEMDWYTEEQAERKLISWRQSQ